MEQKSNKKVNKKVRIVDHVLTILMLPLMVIAAGMKTSEDLSLTLTAGKYSGRGSINKKRKKRYYSSLDEDRVDLIRPSGISNKGLKHAIWRARKKQLIEKRISKTGNVEFVITEYGENKILKKFPLYKLANKKWKGWWMVVAFDIPETHYKLRNSIRKQLLKLGFAQWQKSVYVNPHDIADDLHKMLRENKIEDYVVPLIAKRILAGNDWEFARSLYHMDSLRYRYDQITKILKPPINPREVHWRLFRKQLAIYTKILKNDPFLPRGLCPPKGYGREEAYIALVKFSNSLIDVDL